MGDLHTSQLNLSLLFIYVLQCTIQLSNQLNKNSIIAFQFSLFLFMIDERVDFATYIFKCFLKNIGMSFLRGNIFSIEVINSFFRKIFSYISEKPNKN